MKKLLLLFAVVVLSLTSCVDRTKMSANYEPAVQLSEPNTILLSESTSYAEKRGFADINGDGVEDMVEILSSGFFSKSLKLKFIEGYYGKDSLLNFKENVVLKEFKVPSRFSENLKLDLGDVNGDGLADIIMTEYYSGFSSDRFYLTYLLNQGNYEFKTVEQKLTYSTPNGIFDFSLLLFDRFDNYSDDSMTEYYKADWADIDGNGTDDLVVNWDERNDLIVEVFYTEKTNSSEVSGFVGRSEYIIPNYLYGISISRLDFEDFNNDGLSDLSIYYYSDGLFVGMALNNGDGFTPRKETKVTNVRYDVFGFEKFDTFDANGDGFADFVHLGKIDGVKKISYYLIQ